MNITVAIPTIASRSGLLVRSMASVDAQTYPPYMTVVETDHAGQGAADTRNRALDRVTTEWVAFLDDDDEWYPHHLKALARCAVLSGADVVYPGYDCTGDDPIGCFGIPFDGELLQTANFIPICVLARTEAVRNAGGFQPHPDANGDPCEDWGLWLAMVEQGASFTHLPLKTWLWHNDRPTTRGRADRW